MKKLFSGLATGLFILGMSAASNATTMTTHMTADDAFQLYISTDDSTLGTLVGSHAWWYDTQTFNLTLTNGVTNYIHIVAWDLYGGPTALLGDFTVSDSNFKFANNSQDLVTNTVDWKVYTDGFGGTLGTLVSYGVNNSSPTWGTMSGISSDANWIWDASHEQRYFSTAIYVNSTAVPEPTTMLLFGTGIAGLATVARRKRN